MFVAINRLRIQAGHGEELERQFSQESGLATQEGFVAFELMRCVWQGPKDGTEEYLSVSRWRAQADFERWLHGSAFKRAHANGPPVFMAAPAQPAGYEVRVSRRAAPEPTA